MNLDRQRVAGAVLVLGVLLVLLIFVVAIGVQVAEVVRLQLAVKP